MNVAIVGAGAVGRMVALRLLAKNKDVTIFDRNPLAQPNNAAHASAGMLCPLGEIIHAPQQVLDMGLWSLDRWPSLLKTLKQLDPKGEDVFYQANGSLALAFPQDEQCYKQLQQDLTLKAEQHQDAIAWLNKAELAKLEPSLAQFNKAAWLKTEAQLCNRSFLNATTRVLETQTAVHTGIELDETTLQDLSQQYDWVIDCRGSGAIGKVTHLMEDTTLRGIRGEVLRVQCPEVTLSRPVRVMHPRNSIYIVPKPNNEFVVGATEIESHAEHPITLRSCLELMSTLYAIHPGFAEAQVLETSVGIRTAFSDNIPKVQQQGNVLSANGLYRHGWLVGPAIVNTLMTLMQEARVEVHH
jgi:glycine oxidase